jgi:1-acyl-sn-glycerol-3-phosphate acyltransferase
MPTWYHKATHSLLRSFYTPALLRDKAIAAKGAELLPSEPFLLMADHANALDPYAIGAFIDRPLRYMANIEGVHPLKGLLAGLVGAYGRRKGARDIAAIRETLRLARSGESIGIFPEGDRSWDGASAPIKPGVGRLAKRLGLPLVLARQKGNYLAHPRWASERRRGPWDIEFIVYEADELARMSDGLVDAIVAAAIAKDEIKDAIEEGRTFSGRNLAEGIGRLLWLCPVCGKADGISGRGDRIGCRRCGALWELDANCRVKSLNAPLSLHATSIGDLKDWHDWQVALLPNLASRDGKAGALLASEGVSLSRRSKGRLLRIGKGRLSLRAAGGSGDAILRGAELLFESPEARIAFEADRVRGFVDNFNSFSEFDYRGERWRVELGGGNAVKWSCALSGLSQDRGSPDSEGASA